MTRKPRTKKSRPDIVEQDLRRLAAMSDRDIDLSDIPEMRNRRRAVVGRFYRPVKKSITIRLDADVLAWFKSGDRPYQTAINGALRAHMSRGFGTKAAERKSSHRPPSTKD